MCIQQHRVPLSQCREPLRVLVHCKMLLGYAFGIVWVSRFLEFFFFHWEVVFFLYLIPQKWDNVSDVLCPYQIHMHTISEFSSLTAFLDPSKLRFALLHSLMSYSEHNATIFEGKNSSAAYRWILRSRKSLIATCISLSVHEDCVFLTCYIIWTKLKDLRP